MKKYRKYVVIYKAYKWFWQGERWTYFRCAAEVYTKITLPAKIRDSTLLKVDENNVESWKYVVGGRTIAKVVKYDGK